MIDTITLADVPQSWSATSQLRWFQPTYQIGADGSPLAPILQQAWQGSLGVIRWEVVPTTVERHDVGLTR